MLNRRADARGFTLIELSIVLVIIGLIIGGVLAGQELVRAAAVRAQVTQIQQFDTAVNTFRDKYSYLPGDIPNPGLFGLSTIAGFYSGGNGDGIIQDETGAVPIIDANKEPVMFFIHLSDARLIPGTYTPLVPGFAVGYQFPQTKLGNGGIIVSSLTNGQLIYFLGVTNFQTGGNPYLLNSIATGAIIAPADAYALDTKSDDGFPLTGRVQSECPMPAGCGHITPDFISNVCITTTAQNTYNISNAALACNLAVTASVR
jgi:prepilin-type N-terminal cleavage/methylation domain-containing protein